jgi:hypothetical protein
VVLTQVVVPTQEEVSVVAVAVLTEAVVAASVEEADLMVAAVAVVPAQAGVVALPEADLTNRPTHTRADREASPRACGA